MNASAKILFLLATIAITACTLDIPYENRYSDPDAINTSEKARELLATAYETLPDFAFELSVLSDDFEPTSILRKDIELANLYTWQPLQIDNLSISIWKNYYATIAISNAVLERTALIKNSKEFFKIKQVESEAYMLKAYSFFQLLRFFASDYKDGDEKEGIPLKSKLELEFLPRAKIKTVVETIRDLINKSLEASKENTVEYCFSVPAAYYLLSELELYTGKYDKAIESALKTLDMCGGYSSLTFDSYNEIWKDKTSKERIFSKFITNPYYTGIYLSKDQGDFLTVNTSLVSLYDLSDLRKGATIFTFNLENGTAVQCLGKYNKENKEKRNVQAINKMRISGSCFILAESLAMQGKDNDAIKVMNHYLASRKANLLPEHGLSGERLLKTIIQEKRKEFVGEGERFFDLKRLRKTILKDWNKTGAAASKIIEKDDYRWDFPIPKGEYLYNEQMTQNKGWHKIEW